MKKKANSKIVIILLLSILFSSTANAVNYYAIASGNWNSNITWSLTPGGTPVGAGTWPVAGDVVFISEGASA